MRRLTILMTEEERQALQQMADQDLRDPYVEVRFIIRLEAVRRGILPKSFLPDQHWTLEPQEQSEEP